ncbi:MAG: hypothetical protein EBR02_03625 [Alphaproteobacteria bacterium]|nr:hypothetical protein [Alphaproteobacteria bacterium]
MTTKTIQSNSAAVEPNNISSEYFTDSKQSDIFAEKYRPVARYCHEDRYWLVWDGTHWTPDLSSNLLVLAEESIKTQMQEFSQTHHHEEAKKFVTCLSTGRLRSIGELAKSKMAIKKSEFNPDPWLFNCKNGVINLRTGELLKHSPEYFQCSVANVDYDQNAKCPQFVEFTRQIMLGDDAMISYLQRAMGYTLTGLTEEHCFFFLMGGGRNGKTTLLRIMSYIWSKYSQTVAAKTLMVQRFEQTPSDIAQLEGKRFAQCSETDAMQSLNEARIKSLTGGDEVQARRRYSDEHSFTPQFKLWVATNTMPKISGTDEGIWRRIHKIPFNLNLTPEQVDRELEAKLTQEASGILNWLLEGCMQWQKMGGLNPPEAVKQATREYRAEMDVLGDFITGCLEHVTGQNINNADLYRDFKTWFYENVGDKELPTQKDLTIRLKQDGFVQKGGKTRRWVNVQFVKDDFSEEIPDLTDEEMEEELGALPVITPVYNAMLDDSLPF